MKMIRTLALAALTVLNAGSVSAAVPDPNDKRVLILSTTVYPPDLTCEEAKAAINLDFTVDIATPKQWALIAAGTPPGGFFTFDRYWALILGDPSGDGTGHDVSHLAAADASKEVWSPIIRNGNIILNGEDFSLHARSYDGARTFIANAIGFATDCPTSTGLFASLTSYYADVGTVTPVPALSLVSLGGLFGVVGGSHDQAHLVATHPTLAELDDAVLSDLQNSSHTLFRVWPSDFTVLAIMLDADPVNKIYEANDGTTGAPYILAKGKGLVPVSTACILYACIPVLSRSPNSITVWESTGDEGSRIPSTSLVKVNGVMNPALLPIPGGPTASVYDFATSAEEYYDVYISKEDGTPDIDGCCVTVACYFDGTASDYATGNNIDAVELDFDDDSHLGAKRIGNVQLGGGITDPVLVATHGLASNALGKNDGYDTRLGYDHSRITLCFPTGGYAKCGITVNTADNTDFSAGKTNLYLALSLANTNGAAANTIIFNIPGTGPHYLVPPVGGYPLIIKDNLTIDGYSQPGAVPNTAAITKTNNAVIKIALDARPPNANFRDMAYVFYGSVTTSDPVIDNSAMYGDGTLTPTGRERGGYNPASGFDPTDPGGTYAIGEKAILGIYRAKNVTLKGLAFLSDAGEGYGVSIAEDFGLNTNILDRLEYEDGTCHGFHVAGCVFGVDPGTSADALSQNALTFFRHRDRNGLGPAVRRPAAATDPDNEGVPNGENFIIGVAPGSSYPRAEFNVFKCTDRAIAAGAIRTRVSGNQFFNPPEFSGFNDTQEPSILYGTDGDGVNDADEGNLFENGGLLVSSHNTRNKLLVFAGNTFGVRRDGTRPPDVVNAINEIRFDQGTRVRFGSDFNGVSDALEANRVYDSLLFSFPVGGFTNNSAWIMMRGNSLVNSGVMPPLGDGTSAAEGLNVYDKFINTPIIPLIDGSSTTNLLKGTCGLPVGAPYTKLIVDLYESDPEGDAAGFPQGKTWRAIFVDNSSADTDPAVGAFTFNIASLGIASGAKITIAVTYSTDTQPRITSIIRNGSGTTLNFTGSAPSYRLEQASVVTGPWESIGAASGGTTTFPDTTATSFYRLRVGPASGQTSPFATSFMLP